MRLSRNKAPPTRNAPRQTESACAKRHARLTSAPWDIQYQVQYLFDALRRSVEWGPYQAAAPNGVVVTHVIEGPWEHLPLVPRWNRTVLPDE
jgi:hypothetical protein